MMQTWKYCSLCLSVFLVIRAELAAQEYAVGRIADKLAQEIRASQYQRVGVTPSLSFDSRRETNRVTAHGQLYADQLEAALVSRSKGDFEVVDSATISQAMAEVGMRDHSDRDALMKVASKVGGLDALVMGTIRRDPQDPRDPISNLQQVLTCKLLDVQQSTIKVAEIDRRPYTLADALYEGTSHEFFRWNGQRLDVIGLGDPAPRSTNQVPLNPELPISRFNLAAGHSFQPHPILNPQCPFEVWVEVEGHRREFIAEEPRGAATQRVRWEVNEVFVPLEPGEQFTIGMRRRGSRSFAFRVAVFVDGINIRGKARQLPDRRCLTWIFPADRTKPASFQGWYSSDEDGELLEPFLVTPLEDSIAYQLGETDRIGNITLVFFGSSTPRWDQLFLYRGIYEISSFWNPNTRRWEYEEREDRSPRLGAATGPPVGIGAGAAERVRLNYVRAEPVGPVLAAMTVKYASRAEIAQRVE